MKIYISGAISNNPNFKEDFERAEDYLNKEFPNAEIINPALVNSFFAEVYNARRVYANEFLYVGYGR